MAEPTAEGVARAVEIVRPTIDALSANLGVTHAEVAARLEWLVRDEAARSGDDKLSVLDRVVAVPPRELALALAHRSEIVGLLFAPPTPEVSPETTAGSDATSAADDAALTEAAVQSEANSREPAPDDARDANDAVAGPAPGDGATPRPKKKR